MFWFSLVVAGLSAGREPLLYDLCICQSTCPSACKDMTQFKLSELTNVTDAIEKIHSSFLDVYLDCDITGAHEILLDVFKQTNAKFRALNSGKKPVVELQINGDGNYRDTELDFDGVTAKFTGSQNVALEALTMKNAAIQLDAQASLEVQRCDIDFASLSGINKITVTGTGSRGAFSVVGDVTAAHRGMGQQHIVTLSVGDQHLDVYLDMTSEFELNCNRKKLALSAVDIGAIIGAKYINPSNVSVEGQFPESENQLVLEGETVGIDFRSDHTKFPMLINITGDCFLTVYHDDSQFDKEVYVSGTLWIDSRMEGVVMANLVFDNVTAGRLWMETDHMNVRMNYFICYKEVESLPVVFSVGVNGVSTFQATQIVNITKSPYSVIYCHLNFDTFKTDAELSTLLSKEWMVITLDELEYENEDADIQFIDSPVVHGFSNTTEYCCLKTELRLDNKKVEIVFKQNKRVADVQRRICYHSSARECKDSGVVVVTDEAKLGDLSSELLLDGMQNVSFMIGAATEKLDFSNLKDSQVNITALITYDNTDFAAYAKVGTNKHIQSIHLKNAHIQKQLDLGVPLVWFTKCKKSNQGSLTVGDSTIVYVDQPTLSSNLLSGAKIPDVVVNFVADGTVVMGQSSWTISGTTLNYNDIEQLMLSTGNDLKIDHDTGATDLKGFIAVFHEACKVTLASDFTTINKINPAVVLNHDKNELKVVSHFPGIHASMITLGSGEITYDNDFQGGTAKLCICEGDSCSQCESGRTQVSYSSITSAIKKEAGGRIVDCQLLGTSRTNKPTLILSAVTNKTVHIAGSATSKQWLELDDMEPMENLRFSELELEHISLLTKSTDQKVQVGIFVADDVTMDQTTEELTVDELTCNFELVAGFRKVDVTDNIHLSGSLVRDDDTTVTFVDGDSIQVIHLTLPDAKVVLGKGVVTIGQLKFVTNGAADREMKVEVTPQEGATIEFTSEDVPVKDLPKVQVLATANSNIVFSGEWKDWKQSEYDVVFNITRGGQDTSTITIKENVVPMTIWDLDDYNLVVESTDCGMTGPLRVYKDAPLLSQKGHDDERVKLYLHGGLYI